jgi:hypothetical protein
MSVYLFVRPSVCLPTCLPACLLACLPACLPTCLPACLPACLPVCLSVCLSGWKKWARTGRIFMTFDVRMFLENLSRKFNFH